MTLAQIIEKEMNNRHEGGEYGIKACKESILNKIETNKKLNEMYKSNYPTDIYTLLGEYVDRANKDSFFNRGMVLACWELINEE